MFRSWKNVQLLLRYCLFLQSPIIALPITTVLLHRYHAPAGTCREQVSDKWNAFRNEATWKHFLGAFAKLREATVSFVMSCRSDRPSARNNSAATGWIFMKFDIWVFSEDLSRKLNFHWNLTKITGALREDKYTLMIISRWIFLIMINVSDKIKEKIEHTFCSITVFSPQKSYCWWNNVEKYCRDWQTTDDNMAHDHCMLDT
jgi:hypothetical protein